MPERFEIYIVYKRRYINTLPILFLCFRPVRSERSFTRSSGRILLLRYLAKKRNALNNFDKTDNKYSLAHTDNLLRFWR